MTISKTGNSGKFSMPAKLIIYSLEVTTNCNLGEKKTNKKINQDGLSKIVDGRLLTDKRSNITGNINYMAEVTNTTNPSAMYVQEELPSIYIWTVQGLTLLFKYIKHYLEDIFILSL